MKMILIMKYSVFIVAMCLGSCAKAGFINGGFESGLSGYTTTGTASIESSSIGIAPTEGKSQLLIQSGDVGVASSTMNTLHGFLGIQVGLLMDISTGVPSGGSAFFQVFTITSPSIISFDYNFVTQEDVSSPLSGSNDFAFVSIGKPYMDTGVFLSNPVTFADLFSSFVPASGNFSSETGYRHYSIDLQPGTYKLGFGVINVGDQFGNSGLLVDNISLAPTAIPEPTSLIPLGTGFFALAGYTWHRRQRSTR